MAAEKREINQPETIDEMDEILGKYYTSYGRGYNGYWKTFCEENEWETIEDLADEFAADTVTSDCLVLDFENVNQFPIYSDDKEAIYKILKDIYLYKLLPPQEEKEKVKLSININIPQSIADEIIDKVYKAQLSCIAKLSENEPTLLYFLAVGFVVCYALCSWKCISKYPLLMIYSYANHRMPFLTWMVDAFTMDRQKDYTENNKKTAMTLEQWANQNQFMIELTQKHPKKAEDLKSAMKAYSKRMIPRLQYSPPTKIDDKISEIVDYVSAILLLT